MKAICCICKTEQDTRPFGPDKQPICFPCLKADPKREEEARGHFNDAVKDAMLRGNGTAVLTEEGPLPYDIKNRGEA